MTIIEIIFWLGLFALFYTYMGYLALLWLLTLIRNDPVKNTNITPSVSLVISAYNEGKILSRKIENALELDYPDGLLVEIAIISDGSTDQTNDIILGYAEQNNRILPCIVSSNKGKTACLNDFVPELLGEIVVFTDANSFYDTDLLRTIVRPFADERVGFVTGSTRYFTSSAGRAIEATSLYSRFERIIKSLESKINSCVGADGAIFAIRKELFLPMNPYDINDLVIPLQIVKRGFRGVLEETTYCKEEAAREIKSEFRRQVRITTRTIRAILNYKILLNPFRFTFFAFEIFSHKLMKFLTPLWMVLILITNIPLALGGSLFYKATLITQLLFYIVALIQGTEERRRLPWRFAAICHFFVWINAAYAVGLFKYISGETFISWSPERK